MGGEIKLYEIVATVDYAVVIGAESEEAALEHVATWEQSWPRYGEFLEVLDKEVVDKRPVKGGILHWKDVAHDLTFAAQSAYDREKARLSDG